MSDWNSEQYLRFMRERTQPSIDLAARIPLTAPTRVLDIGCGPGNSTAVLKNRFPDAHIIGADNSQNMLDAARAAYPELEFRLCDASSQLDSLGGGYDVVFSNACIQWLPEHEQLLGEMFAMLSSGGCMAVQLPINQDSPIHQIIRNMAASRRWRSRLPKDVRSFSTLAVEDYYDILAGLTDHFSVWTTCYMHAMPSAEAIIDWYRATGMRPYLDALTPPDAALFEQEALERVREAYPPRRDGSVIFPFLRLFFISERA